MCLWSICIMQLLCVYVSIHIMESRMTTKQILSIHVVRLPFPLYLYYWSYSGSPGQCQKCITVQQNPASQPSNGTCCWEELVVQKHCTWLTIWRDFDWAGLLPFSGKQRNSCQCTKKRPPWLCTETSILFLSGCPNGSWKMFWSRWGSKQAVVTNRFQTFFTANSNSASSW